MSIAKCCIHSKTFNFCEAFFFFVLVDSENDIQTWCTLTAAAAIATTTAAIVVWMFIEMKMNDEMYHTVKLSEAYENNEEKSR